ncbi:UNVERIFIED_CONTAM: hypothetical protein FKN15_076451 [Acipenser sinensis]
MAYKSPALLLLLLLAVMYATLVLANETPYQKFLRQHYHHGGMSVQMCDSEMRKRSLVNPCKETNSFIIAQKNDIIAVCNKAGKSYTTSQGKLMRISLNPFSVVTCKLRGASDRPPCNYRGNSSTRKSVIACENNLPVHYEEGIIAA